MITLLSHFFIFLFSSSSSSLLLLLLLQEGSSPHKRRSSLSVYIELSQSVSFTRIVRFSFCRWDDPNAAMLLDHYITNKILSITFPSLSAALTWQYIDLMRQNCMTEWWNVWFFLCAFEHWKSNFLCGFWNHKAHIILDLYDDVKCNWIAWLYQNDEPSTHGRSQAGSFVPSWVS